MKPHTLILLTIACLGLAACGAPTRRPCRPARPKTQTVKVGIVTPGANHAPFFVTLAKGYFGDLGIQIDYQRLD